MTSSHVEGVRYLTLMQVQEAFELSIDSLHEFRDANGMLSSDIVKAVFEGYLLGPLQAFDD
jgi:hypothetical protein